ncbi:MAG: hypothetical protein NC078_10920 [Ruminococcus sp.]|nr:hypothetical protein [Ruminococcus sp.]
MYSSTSPEISAAPPQQLPKAPALEGIESMSVPWFISRPKLAARFKRCADDIEQSCRMHALAESAGNELDMQLYGAQRVSLLDKFEAYADAIEEFTGRRYFFNRTDEFYGICTENDDYLYLVSKEDWEDRQEEK